MPVFINEQNLESIILSLFESTYRYISKSTPSIFLIGSALKNRTSGSREKIRRLIEKRSPYHRGYEVYYPEDLFDELMKSNKGFNLLDLENMLARSVHGIVIILSSPGSIAELGSFSNNENLLSKLIVIVDKKYKNKNSFIMLGPVKLIKDRDKDRVIFYDSINTDFPELINKIKKELSKNIKTRFDIDETVNNPIALQIFILFVIYVFEKISRDSLRKALKTIVGVKVGVESSFEDDKLVGTIIKILIKKNHIQLNGDKYVITSIGKEEMKKTIGRSFSRFQITKTLDECRIRILNLERKGVKLN